MNARKVVSGAKVESAVHLNNSETKIRRMKTSPRRKPLRRKLLPRAKELRRESRPPPPKKEARRSSPRRRR